MAGAAGRLPGGGLAKPLIKREDVCHDLQIGDDEVPTGSRQEIC